MIDGRIALENLIRERGDDYVSLSRLIGRNAAYIQQFIHRGTPRKLDEDDRRTLAQYFGVDEEVLGGPPAVKPVAKVRGTTPRSSMPFVVVPQLAIGASAGAGALVGDETRGPSFGFETQWLRAVSSSPDEISMIQVAGDSMAPTLFNGDDILVDQSDAGTALRDGIYVIRFDDSLMVKRLVLSAAGPHISVISDNRDYPSWNDCDPETVSIIGRVVWIGRKL